MTIFLPVLLILTAYSLYLWLRRDRAQKAELTRLRADMARSEERLRMMVEDAPEGIIEIDSATGLFVSANAAAARLLGRAGVDELSGLGFIDVSPEKQPDQRASAEVVPNLLQTALSGETLTFEWTICDAAGNRKPTEVRLAAVPESNHLRASLTDISDRVRSRRSLEESEARFRTLVDYATEAIVLLDVETMSFAEVNPSTVALFGYSREQLLRLRPIDLFARAQPDGRPAHVVMEETMQQVLAGNGMVESEIVARRQSGEEFTVIVRSVLLPGARPQIRSTIVDMTDHLRREEMLRVARDEAEKASRTKTAFLAHMSHEIRTPMNGVLGMLELIMDSDLSVDQRQSAELAKSSAESLLSILNDVLDISKIEAGQFSLEKIPFELHAMVSSVVGLVAHGAWRNGVEVRSEIESNVPAEVVGDPVRLRQVLSNLVSNAVKFTRDGEVLVSLKLEGRTDSAVGIGFSVRDTGVGIAADRLGSIFDPFVQADESVTRRFGGTGLGLAICRQLVDLMGGALVVESELGKGSEFRFSLTLDRAARSASTGETVSTDLNGQRVLLLDNSSTSRRVISEALESACGRVLAAGDVYAALRAARIAVAENDPFALAIIDVSIPDQKSMEFVGAVGRDRNLAGMKLLMLSSPDRQAMVDNDGASSSVPLPTPVSEADLVERARALLGTGTESCASDAPATGVAKASPAVMRVLVAEDNAVNQRVATAMLRKRGHEVDVVGNGLAAVEAVRSRCYDVVLMDIQMPDLDGIEATRRIRQEGFDVRIIALTAHATSDDRGRCLEAGMDDFLTKPFQPQEFFRVVEAAGGGRAERAHMVTECSDEPVDIEAFRRAMDEAGVGEIVEDTLRSYLEESPDRIRWLEEAMASGDTDQARKAAHALKSASAAISANGLAKLLERIEKAGKAGDLPGAGISMNEVLSQYEAVVFQLERILAVST